MNTPPNREVALFSAALELPAGQRGAYLDEACADDPALRLRLEALLRDHEAAGAFLETPPPGARESPIGADVPGATVRLSGAPAEKAGDHIGRYKLLQQIGEGGCGVVYMAEQEEPVRRRVALKVIKLGMDTKQVVARFEAERQALALMDHPNIAKVFDAGATDTGRPYFVMELVRGIKITDFCDENQVPTEARLKLFIQVCQAIQHAHQKGIIHRDIKPSNILVADHDGVPVPKIIDFGIAKATTDQRLTDKTLFTAFEQFIGTPAYMSPEQAKLSGLDIDTRSDIYSLGVLLYELLTGQTPFDSKALMQAGLDEIRRIIREEEPERPSTRLSTLTAADLTEVAKRRQVEPAKLGSLIRDDLDWIVMKALEKDRARRYETANGLARDIQRHLNCEPVVARPPSRLYEFQKTVRRHKVGFAAAAAIIMTLAVGVVVSTAEAIRATRAERGQSRLREAAQEAQATEAKLRLEAQRDEERAETEAARSAQVAQFMKDMLKGVGPAVALGRDTKLLREVLDRTAERVSKDLTNQPSVEAELRTTIGEAYYAIGELDQAKTMLRQAVALRKQVPGSGQAGLAISMKDLAMVLWRQNQFAEAETLARDALAIERAALGGEHLAVADSLKILGTVLNSKHDLAGAEVMLREALDIRRKLLGEEHLDVAEALGDLSAVLQRQGKLVEAETMIREALATDKKLLGSEHPSLAGALNGLGNVLRQEGKLPEAESVFRDALKMRRSLLAPGHPDLVQSLNNLGKVLEAEGKLDDAEALYQEVLTIYRTLPGADRTDAGASLDSLAAIARRQGRLQKAEELSREALARAKKLAGNESRAVDHSLVQLADILREEGKLTEAERVAREELAVERVLSGPAAPNVAKSLRRVADILYEQGKWADAEARCREAIALFKQSAQDNPKRSDYAIDLGHSQWRLADVLAKTGHRDQTEPILREALRVFEQAARDFPAEPNLRLEQALSRRMHGDVLEQLGRVAEAQSEYRAAIGLYAGLEASAPTNFWYRHEEAYTTWSLAETLQRAHLRDAAEAEYRRAITLHEKAIVDFPNETVLKGRLGTIKIHLADFFRQSGKLAEAEQVYREALAAYAKSQAEGGDAYTGLVRSLLEVLKAENKLKEGEAFCRALLAQQRATFTNGNSSVAETLSSLAENLAAQDKPAEAEAALREALRVCQQSAGPNTSRSEDRARLGHLQWQLAQMLADRRKPAEAEQLFLEAFQVFEKASQDFPHEPFMRQEQAWTTWMLAAMLEGAGRLDAAEAEYRHAIALHRKASVDFPNEAVFAERLGTLNVRLLELLCRRGKLAEAKSMYREAGEHGSASDLNALAWSLATSADPNLRDGTNAVVFAEKAVTTTSRKQVGYLGTLAAAYAETGQFTKAISAQQEAIALSQGEPEKKDLASRLKLYENKSPYRDHGSLAELTKDRLVEGKYAEAEGLARECLAIREREIPDDWRTFNARSMLGGALLGQKKYAEAEPLLLSGYEGMKQREVSIPPEGKPRLRETLERLMQLYEATNRPGQAAGWKQKLAALGIAEK